MSLDSFSRPARLAAQLSGVSDEDAARLFYQKSILVRLQPEFSDMSDARETLIYAVNQLLRFCPNIHLLLEGDGSGLAQACNELARRIHGPSASINMASSLSSGPFDAILNIGNEVLAPPNSATVNSTGWIGRLAAGERRVRNLHWSPDLPNPLGALLAACLGVHAVFFIILGKPFDAFSETSLFSHESGSPGTLKQGPPLPIEPLRLDTFLVGCGAVSNGWAYAIKRLPIVGKLEAIDPQSLRPENLGPYVASSCQWLGRPKVELLKSFLSPAIEVVPRGDHWELFTLRLKHELKVPRIIISGLDKVGTRHSLQRVWPETLIDMGAEGLESQVIVKHRNSDGLCLLNALTVPPEELNWAQTGAVLTGMNPELIASDPTGEITQAEIDAAPTNKREQLQAALGTPMRLSQLRHA